MFTNFVNLVFWVVLFLISLSIAIFSCTLSADCHKESLIEDLMNTISIIVPLPCSCQSEKSDCQVGKVGKAIVPIIFSLLMHDTEFGVQYWREEM
jgi:hypothetical protein